MTDTFASRSNQEIPATNHFLIVPSDTVGMNILPRAIYCAADGTAQIVDGGGVVLAYAMTAGTYFPFRGVRINATGTTGTFYGWY